MNRSRCRIGLFVLFLPLLGACASTTVKKDPGPHDRGVRFYRPKPHLLLTPTEGKSDDYVSMSLQWLPDYSEEYSIHVRAGIGINKTQIKLENGWNLTSVNFDIDSSTDENLTALAKVIPEAIKIGTSGGGGNGDKPNTPPTPPVKVKATNVPLGYYEAVIGTRPDGRKQLFGWRYLGFLPYTHCPVDASGGECAPCQAEALFGLVFENGVMTFRPLNDTRVANNIRNTVSGAETMPETLKRIQGQAVATYQLVLQMNIAYEDVSVTLKDKTFVVSVSLVKEAFAKIKDVKADKEAEIVLNFQPELLKLMRNDQSWVALADIREKK